MTGFLGRVDLGVFWGGWSALDGGGRGDRQMVLRGGLMLYLASSDVTDDGRGRRVMQALNGFWAPRAIPRF